MGSPVNTAVFVQFDAATPNCVLHENNHILDHPLNEILEQPLTLEDGYILVPDGPGIGVEVREEKLDQFPFEPRTIQGRFRADGSCPTLANKEDMNEPKNRPQEILNGRQVQGEP